MTDAPRDRIPLDDLTDRLRPVATAALDLYDLTDCDLTLLSRDAPIAFRVDRFGQPERYLLRVHPRSSKALLHGRDAIRSELLWLDALAREGGIAVQRPVRNRAGELVTEVAYGRKATPVLCTVLRWLEGRPLPTENDPSPDLCRRMGALMAALHGHARTWRLPDGFVRPRYDDQALEEALVDLDRAKVLDAVSGPDFTSIQTAVQRVRRTMTEVGFGSEAFGLIHANLHRGTCLLYGEEVRPVGFERCGFGHYLFDAAVSLRRLAPEQRVPFLEGYVSAGDLPEAYQEITEALFIGGSILALAGLARRYADHARLARAAPRLVGRQIRRLFADEPFLFDT